MSNKLFWTLLVGNLMFLVANIWVIYFWSIHFPEKSIAFNQFAALFIVFTIGFLIWGRRKEKGID